MSFISQPDPMQYGGAIVARHAQPRSGQPSTSSAAPRPHTSHTAKKAPFVAKGHDKRLQDAQEKKLTIDVHTTSGQTVRGVIVFRDRYTVTVKPEEDFAETPNLTIYKSAIVSFAVWGE